VASIAAGPGRPSGTATEERPVTETDDQLADPEEHPEQHAARHTGQGAEAQPQEETDNEFLDSEEHSDAEGPFGTG
jgi:hypothetical protein